MIYHDSGGVGGGSVEKPTLPPIQDGEAKAAAYDALLDAFAEDFDRRLAEINMTLDRLAA